MAAEPLPRRILVSHAAPTALAPMTQRILARLGYAILEPEEFSRLADEYERPDLLLVDERRLAEIGDDGGPPIPIVALTGRHGVTGADPRIVGALRRPAGLHELFRLLQQVLEENPRSSPRVATHLAVRCRNEESEWRATLLSLSENGCLLRSPRPLTLGSELELGLVLPRAGAISLHAEVAYQLLPDVGLVFSAMPVGARTTLSDWVSGALSAL